GQPACVALSTPSASSSAARFASLPPSFPPAPARDRPASELFFILQLLRRDLRYHGAQPIDLSLLPRLDSALARCPLAFTLQRACGPVIRNSAPSIKHRWRQAVSATDLADRYPRLLRFPQNRQLLFRCKSPILTHGPRASCGLPAAARSFPFFGFVFVPKSLKLHMSQNEFQITKSLALGIAQRKIVPDYPIDQEVVWLSRNSVVGPDSLNCIRGERTYRRRRTRHAFSKYRKLQFRRVRGA